MRKYEQSGEAIWLWRSRDVVETNCDLHLQLCRIPPFFTLPYCVQVTSKTIPDSAQLTGTATHASCIASDMFDWSLIKLFTQDWQSAPRWMRMLL